MGRDDQVRQVGREQRAALDGRLLGEDVYGCAADLPSPQRGGERVDVDQRAPCGVHENRIRLHEGEFARADQALRGGSERAVQRDDVGAGQQFVEVDAPGFAFTARAVCHQCGHAERALAGLRDGAAEHAPADDAQRPARQQPDGVVEHGEVRAAAPAAVHGDPGVVTEAVGQVQYDTQHVLRDRWRAVVADVAHRDAVLARGFDVDVVGAGGGQRDESQLRRCGDDLAGDPQLVQQHDGAPGDVLGDVALGRGAPQFQAGHGRLEPGRVEVADADRGVVEEDGTHREMMPRQDARRIRTRAA